MRAEARADFWYERRLVELSSLDRQFERARRGLEEETDREIFDFLRQRIEETCQRGGGRVSLVKTKEDEVFPSSQASKAIVRVLLWERVENDEELRRAFQWLDDCFRLWRVKQTKGLVLLLKEKQPTHFFPTSLSGIDLVVGEREKYDEWDYSRPPDFWVQIGKLPPKISPKR